MIAALEARRTFHCSVCDTELQGGDEHGECPQCAAWAREAEYRALVEAMLPWLRLYSPPEDSPDFATDTAKLQRTIKRAEKSLAGLKVRWNEAKSRWEIKRVARLRNEQP